MEAGSWKHEAGSTKLDPPLTLSLLLPLSSSPSLLFSLPPPNMVQLYHKRGIYLFDFSGEFCISI